MSKLTNGNFTFFANCKGHCDEIKNYNEKEPFFSYIYSINSRRFKNFSIAKWQVLQILIYNRKLSDLQTLVIRAKRSTEEVLRY